MKPLFDYLKLQERVFLLQGKWPVQVIQQLLDNYVGPDVFRMRMKRRLKQVAQLPLRHGLWIFNHKDVRELLEKQRTDR